MDNSFTKRRVDLLCNINENDFFLEEMPLVFRTFVKEADKVDGTTRKLTRWVDAFFDQCWLTYSVGFAALLSQKDNFEDRKKVSENIFEMMRSKGVEDYKIFRKGKLESQWYKLANEFMPDLINKFGPENPSGILADMASRKEGGDIITIRNELTHVFKSNNMNEQEWSEKEYVLREVCYDLWSYWHNYDLGYVDHEKQQIIFMKDRNNEIPENIVSGIYGKIPDCNNPDARIAVLLDERNGTLTTLSPFVIFKLLQRKQLKRASDVKYNYTLYYLDFPSSRKICWKTGMTNSYSEKDKDDGLEVEFMSGSEINNFKFIRNFYPKTFNLDNEGWQENIDNIRKIVLDLEFTLEGDDKDKICTRVNDSIDYLINIHGSSIIVAVNVKDTKKESENKYAAKILKPKEYYTAFNEENITRFNGEIKFLETCSNPNGAKDDSFIKFKGKGKIKSKIKGWHNQPFFIMEYIPTTLKDVLTTDNIGSAINPRTKRYRDEFEDLLSVLKLIKYIYYIERVAGTLKNAYTNYKGRIIDSHGLEKETHFIHRDINQLNLLDAGYGEMRICDLGAAYFPKDVCEKESDIGIGNIFTGERISNINLSRKYCAPEIWENPDFYSETADVYSLGVILYELLVKPKDKKSYINNKETDYTLKSFQKNMPNVYRKALARMRRGAIELLFETVKNALQQDHNDRMQISVFHSNLMSISYRFRERIVELCNKVIDKTLKDFESNISEKMEVVKDCLIFLSTALGLGQATSLLRLDRCESCKAFDCKNKEIENIINAVDFTCESSMFKKNLKALAEIQFSTGLVCSGKGLKISEACKIICLVKNMLNTCNGLANLAPRLIEDHWVKKPNPAPHSCYDDVIQRLLRPVTKEEFKIVKDDYKSNEFKQKKVTKKINETLQPKSFVEDLLVFLAEVATSDNIRIS